MAGVYSPTLSPWPAWASYGLGEEVAAGSRAVIPHRGVGRPTPAVCGRDRAPTDHGEVRRG